MNNTIVLCHGRTSRKILELNYDSTIFVDSDPDTNPDFILDIGNTNVEKKVGQKFNNVINAFCPTALELEKIIIYDDDLPIDGSLDKIFIKNIKDLLLINGYFYCKSMFWEYIDDEPINNNYKKNKNNLYILQIC